MLTLKHFLDNPTWAEADGYAFNYFDCMAFTASQYGGVFLAVRGVAENFLDTEVRELPFVLLVLLAALIWLIVWPLTFWLAAIWIWVRCRHHRRKYHLGSGMTAIARKNLDTWKVQFERNQARQ